MPEHEPTMTGEKLCTKCGDLRPVHCFAANKSLVCGLNSWCRSCGNEQVMENYARTKLAEGVQGYRGSIHPGKRKRGQPKVPTFQDWEDVT